MQDLPTFGLIGILAIGITASAPISRDRALAEAVPAHTIFDSEMAGSMARMHAAMDLQPTGDPDRDFAAMMIPHHQGAIDMARAELAPGRDPVLRRLAQSILVEQAQEIEVMRRALVAMQPLPSRSAGTASAHDHHSPDPKAAHP